MRRSGRSTAGQSPARLGAGDGWGCGASAVNAEKQRRTAPDNDDDDDDDVGAGTPGTPRTSETRGSPTMPAAQDSVLQVLLYVPNLIGYCRLLMFVVGLWFEPVLPGLFVALYIAQIALDGVDGYLARKLNQCSVRMCCDPSSITPIPEWVTAATNSLRAQQHTSRDTTPNFARSSPDHVYALT